VNLKSLSDLVTSKAGRQVLKVQKHSPVLLFGAGIAGIIVTVVLASRATLKLEEVLEDMQDDKDKVNFALETAGERYDEKDAQKDLVLLNTRYALRIAKMYAPAVAVGIVSIAALTGSHVILTRRNVALTAAYAALDRGFRQYRQRVVDALGREKDEEFRYGCDDVEIVDETENGPVVRTVKRAKGPSIYAKYWDEGCPDWNPNAAYNIVFLKCQMQHANDKLRARGHLFLNEVYESLGMKHTKEGAIVGWVYGGGGDDYVDFGCFDPDKPGYRDFINGWNKAILLDFNVDGVIYDKI
jgi:hypothetical protein